MESHVGTASVRAEGAGADAPRPRRAAPQLPFAVAIGERYLPQHAPLLAIVLILVWRRRIAYRLWRPAGVAQSRDNGRVSPFQDSTS
ncbi:hypothetical protein ACFOPN_13175 [Xanthomonas hyacinthi]|uniref:hypothetical protein n=1 Tax=Xanthomonas hyacinthi TaxID=56455 RepID=UPI00062D4A62|nr:hypothetical protein Y886_24330 [Xanthomonas hyacinthi DSM 19077]